MRAWCRNKLLMCWTSTEAIWFDYFPTHPINIIICIPSSSKLNCFHMRGIFLHITSTSYSDTVEVIKHQLWERPPHNDWHTHMPPILSFTATVWTGFFVWQSHNKNKYDTDFNLFGMMRKFWVGWDEKDLRKAVLYFHPHILRCIYPSVWLWVYLFMCLSMYLSSSANTHVFLF